ncbi:MAG: hypothetical protein HFE90_02645 [Firmicutes bacterium]|nr:hypothetical protein [Bacillota bacterium]
MNNYGYISDWLRTLVDEYDFNIETLSNCLRLSSDQIVKIKEGNIDVLPQEVLEEQKDIFDMFSKIGFIYGCIADDENVKLSAFLDVLITYHNISKETIAKMSGIEIEDIENILYSDKNNVADDIKFKLAVTVFSLRFFLKDNENMPA